MNPINKVGIVGGGTMGRGIAVVVAQAGMEVVLCEKDPESAENASVRLSEDLDYEISRWALTASDKRALIKKISVTADLSKCTGMCLVVEAVPEELELKVKLFKQLSAMCPENSIFVTNTSTLSITKMAERLPRPDLFIGVHFMNPVMKMGLVELIRGMKTSDVTYQMVREFLLSLGKTPIEVYEYPGYVTTRIILPMINEAMQVVLEGIASPEDVDTAMKLGYNMEIGPLALADRMGLDEVMKWMEHLFRELGDLKYRPCPILRRKVRAGELGVKTGKGFFEYRENTEIESKKSEE
ncbi:MAG: 3-hydroxyacyl-CoA dehydrogenase NAD-binding domain-containing protein [Terriglobia bacterium]